MKKSSASESVVEPEIISPEQKDKPETSPVRRASNLKFAALDYNQAEEQPLPEPEQSKPADASSEEPETKQLPPPVEDEPKPQPEPTPEVEVEDEPPLRGIHIPPMLASVLGFMSLLLFLVGVGLLIAHYWESIPMLVRVISLVLIPSFLWVVYVIGFSKGHRSAELATLLSAISWLDALLIYQFCIQPLPLWILGSIFTFGLMLIPLIKPWRMAVCALACGAIAQFGLMIYGMATAGSYGSWAVIWASTMAMMMVWSHIGSWCALTKRRGYRSYAIIGPISQFIFLLMVVGMLTYPQHLVAFKDGGSATLHEWLAIMGVWLVAMLPILPLQRHFAAVCNHPNISNSFLLYWAVSILVGPLGFLLVNDLHPLLLMPLTLGYLFSMVYYGADYRVPNFVIMGSIGIFLTLVSIPIHLELGLIGSAVVLFVLSVGFFVSMIGLNRRRKVQIMRRREEIATMRAVERERHNLKTYREKERISIELPNYEK